MRRILLSLASIWVGAVTLATVLVILFGSVFSIISFVFGLIFALLVGVAMSAPHFVRPAAEVGTMTLWIPAAEIPALAWVFKILAAIGLAVLRGLWFLIHKGFDRNATPKAAP